MIRKSVLLLFTILVIILLGIIVYLTSLLNARTYFLVFEKNKLKVEQGILFPAGRKTFTPSEQSMVLAYAPVDVPGGYTPARKIKRCNGILELNTSLFDEILKMTEFLIKRGTEQDYKKALLLAERASRIPGIDLKRKERLDNLYARLAVEKIELTFSEIEKKLISLKRFLNYLEDGDRKKRYTFRIDAIISNLREQDSAEVNSAEAPDSTSEPRKDEDSPSVEPDKDTEK